MLWTRFGGTLILEKILVTASVQNGLSYFWLYSLGLGAELGLGLGLGLINLSYAVKISSYDWAPPLACHKSHSPLAVAVLGVRCLHTPSLDTDNVTFVTSFVPNQSRDSCPRSMHGYVNIPVFLEWFPISLSVAPAGYTWLHVSSICHVLTDFHAPWSRTMSRTQLRVTLRFLLCCSYCLGISICPAANYCQAQGQTWNVTSKLDPEIGSVMGWTTHPPTTTT